VADAQAKKVIQDCSGTDLFLSSGCAMGRNTKPENMEALTAAADKYGTYEQIMEMQENKG
jgi:uroporphyrinogen decarboxylase